jgi:hypothetical protein
MTRPLPLILICGDSLLLAGLEASLRGAAGVQVQTLKPQTLKVSETFRVLSEGAVAVYDQAETDLGLLAPWLADCPGLTLLGLDAERDRIHVVTGHSQAVRAVGDLSRLVLEAACSGDKETSRQGNK